MFLFILISSIGVIVMSDKLRSILRKVVIGLCLISMGVIVIANAQNVKTYIPPQAFDYKEDIKTNLDRFLPELPDYNFFPALIEHESCISLTHSKCWSPSSQLKTSREQGVGFFQLTRAWDTNGKLRFDTISDLKRTYRTHLSDLNWDNVRTRSDLQIRAGTLLMMQNYNQLKLIPDERERLAFLGMAHNSGMGWVNKERRACGLKSGCDPQKYFDNVQNSCLRSKKPMQAYGGKSICDISARYSGDILDIRMPKYQEQYFK